MWEQKKNILIPIIIYEGHSFNHINIDMNNTFIPDGQAENPEEYCKKYDKLIEEKGGIDLQILGIGENGHIAFNEPDEELNVGTSIVGLTESTIEANSRFFLTPQMKFLKLQ